MGRTHIAHESDRARAITGIDVDSQVACRRRCAVERAAKADAGRRIQHQVRTQRRIVIEGDAIVDRDLAAVQAQGAGRISVQVDQRGRATDHATEGGHAAGNHIERRITDGIDGRCKRDVLRSQCDRRAEQCSVIEGDGTAGRHIERADPHAAGCIRRQVGHQHVTIETRLAAAVDCDVIERLHATHGATEGDIAAARRHRQVAPQRTGAVQRRSKSDRRIRGRDAQVGAQRDAVIENDRAGGRDGAAGKQCAALRIRRQAGQRRAAAQRTIDGRHPRRIEGQAVGAIHRRCQRQVLASQRSRRTQRDGVVEGDIAGRADRATV